MSKPIFYVLLSSLCETTIAYEKTLKNVNTPLTPKADQYNPYHPQRKGASVTLLTHTHRLAPSYSSWVTRVILS